MPELVAAALAEDVGPGDRTTQWTVPEGARGRARIVAREAGVVAGTGPATEAFRLVGPDTEVRWRRGDGERVGAGGTVAVVEGRTAALLTAERTALNFLARLSGVATTTARYVEAVEGTGCRVTDTRKTAPGWRDLEKAATAAGGAVNHRSGLHDMVLIKENHVRAAGGVRAALEAAVSRAREAGIPVEVEVGTLDDLDAALAGAPDRILLDNMEVPDLREAVRRASSAGDDRPVLEASGGVTLETVRAVAETGVDLVSVGALTHSAPALDVSMLLEEA
jgi:nicotinate-nucleotide pyrophosphorylase (carboxylating)